FLGRNDFQVKIRGFRVELEEIEAQLLRQPGIRQAVVLAREDSPGDKRLVAYCVSDREIDVGELRTQLLNVLPEYMAPASCVQLESLPLTPSGKIDRKALPAPDASAYAARDYEEPANDMEMQLARIWSELLNVERVSRYDDFFALGGHSLLAVRLVARLRQALGVELALVQLFERSVLWLLAESIREAKRSEAPPITIASREQPLPLSFAQQRLWFIAQMDAAAGVAYHMPFGLELRGRVGRQAPAA